MNAAIEWRPVIGFEAIYEVSSTGLVRRMTSRTGAKAGMLIRPYSNKEGYESIHLRRDGVQSNHSVHRLVALAFHGQPETGQEVCHADGNPANNEASNLRWDTHSANVRDSVKQGNHPHAQKTECDSGHAFDEANTYVYRGSRNCRSCNRAAARRVREQRARA